MDMSMVVNSGYDQDTLYTYMAFLKVSVLQWVTFKNDPQEKQTNYILL